MRTSEALTVGEVYTRADLRELFEIADKTLETGIFQPKGHDSVWLFVTEDKPADRTQYHDQLVDDTLAWEGQTRGRKDRLIIEHADRRLELLLFYRERRNRYRGAGFRYEGPFRYISHAGAQPTRFVLQRVTDG